MKYRKILIAVLITVAIMVIGNIKVKAASAEITALNQTAEVGDNVTITVKFTAAAWNLKVSGNGITGTIWNMKKSSM